MNEEFQKRAYVPPAPPSYQRSIDDRQRASERILFTIDQKQKEIRELQRQVSCLREARELVDKTY